MKLQLLLVGLVLSLHTRADPLDDWAEVYLRALRAENTTPPLGARNTAVFTIAVADAVNAIEHRWHPFLFTTNLSSPVSIEAAVAGASYRTGIALYPSRRADFEALLNRTRTNLPATPAREAGFQLGFASAEALLEARASDGTTQVPYIPSDKPGAWRRTPPYFRPPDLPHWGLVRPFALTNSSQFRPPGPPSLRSDRYVSDYNEVKSVGSKTSLIRTADQTQAARFWSDFSGTVTPPGHWTQITLALAQSNHLALPDKARLLALVHISLADAGIACWDAKYTYNFWRPVTAAIRADDGNPKTESDPNWESLLIAPAFPDYVSGHSTFTGAGAQVLRRWFGRDDLSFSVTSDTVPGVTRSFLSLNTVATEIGMSRIWGGIHFHSADADGQELGRRVGDWAFNHTMAPLPATYGRETRYWWYWKAAVLLGILGFLYAVLRGWRRQAPDGTQTDVNSQALRHPEVEAA